MWILVIVVVVGQYLLHVDGDIRHPQVLRAITRKFAFEGDSEQGGVDLAEIVRDCILPQVPLFFFIFSLLTLPRLNSSLSVQTFTLPGRIHLQSVITEK